MNAWAVNHPEDREPEPATSRYGFHCVLKNLGFDQAIAHVTEALKAEGFGVLTDIDVQATMKLKLGVAMRAYRILGACNPPLAHRALVAEPDIGLLLPCNVVVRRDPDDTTVHVEAMNPQLLVEVTGDAKLRPVADEVTAKLQSAIDSLGG